MEFYVGVTDKRWYDFLSVRAPDEVNFWRPSAQGFGAIPAGAPFLFKLHSPLNYIVGGGYFSIHSKVNLRFAWDAFGEKNGTTTFAAFQEAIASYRHEIASPSYDPEIGCTVLSQPFFFPREQWIPVPSDWAGNIVKGKVYSMVSDPGISLWREVRARIEGLPASSEVHELVGSGQALGKDYLRRARVGQGAFRLMTMENFRHRCCITGETTSPVLQAAHIKPVSQKGQHSIRNGLLLRADLHILYDQGLIGVDHTYRVRISPQIKDRFLNGRVYYAHEGEPLRSLPSSRDLRPDPELLDWHMGEVFCQ